MQQPTCLAPGVPGQNLILAWRVAGSGEVELSADTPGVAGSLRRGLPDNGTLAIRFGCSGVPGGSETHVFDLYVGSGSGPTARVTVSAAIPGGPSTAATDATTTPTLTAFGDPSQSG
ncbi:MAG: hypothetical protein HOW97_43750 [Catenulispora sp.]|nr:hypothetical protein [Catenulispora sp.]